MKPYPTRDEVVGCMSSLSNWGRWGPDDQRGTLNLITPEVVQAALRLPKYGRRIPLGRSIGPSRTQPNSPLHFMISSGDSAPDLGFGGSTDWIGLAFHGHAVTHLDAPSHIFWNGTIYNGHSAKRVTTTRGAEVGSVEHAATGVLARGILADIPRARGVARLGIDEAILSTDLDECLREAGIEPRAGDVLLVRTGRDADAPGTAITPAGGHAGLHAECLPWLRSHDIAMLVADVAQEVQPSGYDDLIFPLHTVGMVAMGLWLIDNAFLEELAAACAEVGRWEFLFMLAPLRIKNATGSPVNPVAVL